MIKSIKRGVDVLKSLANGTDRISDLCNELKMSKSTVYRLLETLESLDLAKQDPISRRYYLGPLVVELSSKPLIAHQNLVICAYDEMQHLRGMSRETVIIHVRIGSERICLEEVLSPEPIKYSAGKGSIAPIWIGSAGKILLSELEDYELQLILKNIELVRMGPNTITDKKILLEEIEKVRKEGFAVSIGERIAGAASISVPIKNYVCPVSLSILGPENRVVPVMFDFLENMKESAAHISNKFI